MADAKALRLQTMLYRYMEVERLIAARRQTCVAIDDLTDMMEDDQVHSVNTLIQDFNQMKEQVATFTFHRQREKEGLECDMMLQFAHKRQQQA